MLNSLFFSMNKFLTSELAKYHLDRYLTSFLKSLAAVVAGLLLYAAYLVLSGISDHGTLAIIWDKAFLDGVGVSLARQLLVQLPIDLFKGNFKSMPAKSDTL